MTAEQLAVKYAMYSIQKHVPLRNVCSNDEAHNLILKAKEMVIRPPPFMRSYRSNETVVQYQQSPIKEQSTKRDSLSTDMLVANDQMSDQGIQTDVTFIQKPQKAVCKVRSLDNHNLVKKHIPPISKSTEEEKLKFISICNRDEFLIESKEIKQNLI